MFPLPPHPAQGPQPPPGPAPMQGPPPMPAGMLPPPPGASQGPLPLPPGMGDQMGAGQQYPSQDPNAVASLLGPPFQADLQAFQQGQLQAAIAGAMMATNQPSPDQLAAQGQPTMGAAIGGP